MAVLPPKGKTVDRRPSMKGKIMQDVSNGAERSRAWPRDRGKSLHPKTKEQMEWFRQAQWATKYMDPKMLISFKEATAGTPLLPRDMATMMFAGRLFMIDMLDGRKLYSVQVLKDVSESLDVISQTPGFQLLRGPVYWEGVQQITGNRVSCRLTRVANLAVMSNAAAIPVPWTAETIDQSNFWNIATPNDIVIPATGWYQMSAEWTKSNQTSNFPRSEIYVNGAIVSFFRTYLPNSFGTPTGNHQHIAYLQAGDIVQLRVANQGAGGNFFDLRFSIVGNA